MGHLWWEYNYPPQSRDGAEECRIHYLVGIQFSTAKPRRRGERINAECKIKRRAPSVRMQVFAAETQWRGGM